MLAIYHNVGELKKDIARLEIKDEEASYKDSFSVHSYPYEVSGTVSKIYALKRLLDIIISTYEDDVVKIMERDIFLYKKSKVN